jgi:hypothetical protein
MTTQSPDLWFASLTQDEKVAYRAGLRAASSPRAEKQNPYARHSQARLWSLWRAGYADHAAFLSSIDQ